VGGGVAGLGPATPPPTHNGLRSAIGAEESEKKEIIMGTIHVNTDVMRQLASRFIQCNEYIRDQLIPELQRLSAQMEGDWVGVSRSRYDELIHGWNQNAFSLQNWGTDLGQHLYRTADQFDSADQS